MDLGDLVGHHSLGTSLSREHEKNIYGMPISKWSWERIFRDYHEVIWIEYAGILIPILQLGFMG
jgi:hypothetical protein